jgi:hypothetical protein
MCFARLISQTGYFLSWFLPLGIGCGETEVRQHQTPTANREVMQAAPLNQVDARSLLVDIKPGEPLSRHHRKLAAHAAKVGSIIFGGSGSGEVYYQIGGESIRVGFTGPSSEIHSAAVHIGSWPDGLEVGETSWMCGVYPVDFDILRNDQKFQRIDQ